MDNKIREPVIGKVGAWVALQAAMALSFATWQALAVLAGYDSRYAWEMALAVDGYVVSSLALWMAQVPAVIADFARKNTYAAAAIGVVAQSAYHGITAALAHRGWPVVTLAAAIGTVPPLFAALSIHARALIRRHALLALAERHAAAAVTPAVTPAVTAASVVPPAALTDTPVDTATDEPATADTADATDDLADVMDAVAERPPAPRRQPAGTDTGSALAAGREKRELGKKLLRQGDTVESVSADLGVPERTVYRWQQAVRAEQADQTVGARP